MSSISDLEKFNKTYSWLVQDCLNKIKPASIEEISVAIEALKSITEPEENHLVHPSLKGRIDDITSLVDEETAKEYGLKNQEERDKLKEIILFRTSEKIKHFVHLIEHDQDAQAYFEQNQVQNSKAAQNTIKTAVRKVEENENDNQEKHVLSDEDWDAWEEYKYGIQDANKWSVENREKGWNNQNLEGNTIQTFINESQLEDIYGNAINVAPYLRLEQIGQLNDDQVYVIGSLPLFRNFMALIISGMVPFDQLKSLEKEKFQMIVDFAGMIIEYLNLGVAFNELTDLPLHKLLICLYQSPEEVKKLLQSNEKFEFITQISTTKLKKILANFSLIEKFMQHSFKVSEFKEIDEEQLDFVLRNGDVFLKFLEYSGHLQDFLRLAQPSMSSLVQLLTVADEFPISLSKMLQLCPKRPDWPIFFLGYQEVYRQSLAVDEEKITNFLQKHLLSHFFSTKQFLDLTAQQKSKVCLFYFINPLFFSPNLFEILKNMEDSKIIERLSDYQFFEQVILTPNDFVAMLKIDPKKDLYPSKRLDKFLKEPNLLENMKRNMKTLRDHGIDFQMIWSLRYECRMAKDLTFIIKNKDIIASLSSSGREIFDRSYREGPSYISYCEMLFKHLDSIENILSSLTPLDQHMAILCLSMGTGYASTEHESRIDKLEEIFNHPEEFKQLLKIWPFKEFSSLWADFPTLSQFMDNLNREKFKVMLSQTNNLKEIFERNNNNDYQNKLFLSSYQFSVSLKN